MHKKFEVNWTKIKGGCQSYRKAAPQESWIDLTLDYSSAYDHLGEQDWDFLFLG